MRQSAACVFIAVFVATSLLIGVGSAAAVVPTWEPEPERAEEEVTEVEEGATEEVAAEEGQLRSNYPSSFHTRGADFNRLGAEELVLLPGLELGAFQAVNGMILGWLICDLRTICSSDAFRASGVAGFVIGAGGSILATYYLQPAPGQIAGINTGSWLGMFTGFAISEWSRPGNTEAYMVLGGLAGMAAGGLATTGLRATAGDVALINLGALLSAATLIMIDEFGWNTLLSDYFFGDESRALGFVGVSMLGGGLVAWRYPMDRFRVRAIGASALVGGVAGAVVMGALARSDTAIMAGFGMGMIAGAGAMGYLSRETDAHFRLGDGEIARSIRPAVVPSLDGRGMTLSLSGRF